MDLSRLGVDEQLYEVQRSRHWKDCCEHPEETYLFSFTHPSRVDGEKYDVYLFQEGSMGHSLCLRFGDDDPDYRSPGGVDNVISFANADPAYASLLQLLRKLGYFTWVPHE